MLFSIIIAEAFWAFFCIISPDSWYFFTGVFLLVCLSELSLSAKVRGVCHSLLKWSLISCHITHRLEGCEVQMKSSEQKKNYITDTKEWWGKEAMAAETLYCIFIFKSISKIKTKKILPNVIKGMKEINPYHFFFFQFSGTLGACLPPTFNYITSKCLEFISLKAFLCHPYSLSALLGLHTHLQVKSPSIMLFIGSQ